MIKNFIKIAFRNLMKNKLHSVINILGLSLGIGVCILIYLFVSNEFSYDSFHENGDRIFRVENVFLEKDGSNKGWGVHAPIPFGPSLEQDIPEIEYAIRFSESPTFVRTGDLADEEDILYAGKDFFKVFSFDFATGTPSKAFNDISSVVLSKKAAEKYFGGTNPLGKELQVLLGENYKPLTVTGVIENIPSNSSIKFDFLLPYELMRNYNWFREREDSWNSWNSPAFILLKEGTDAKLAESKMIAFWEKYMGKQFEEMRAEGEWKFDYQPIQTRFQPLRKIHHTELRFSGTTSYSNPVYAYILAGIAAAILLIACINFMNLSISKSSNRSGEIAVRKIVGASRKNLIFQFWGEAVFLSFFAMLAALLFVELALPSFNKIIENNLKLNMLDNRHTLLSILFITLTAGLIAGSYPAILMSSLRPVQIFSKKISFGKSNIFTRILMTFQFSLAVFLIAATIIMMDQMSFIKNKNLGFDKEQVVVIRGNYQKVDATRVMNVFKNELKNDPAVEKIAGISYSFNRGYDQVGWQDSKSEDKKAYIYRVDENFLSLMNIKLTAGRNFNLKYQTDSTDAVIVNEELLKVHEIKNPLEGTIDGFKNRSLDNPNIIGVVKNFNFSSLEEKVEPAILYMSSGSKINYILAKLKRNKIEEGLESLRKKWNEIVPDIPFQFSFLDEDLNKQYKDAGLKNDVINYSAGFAIFIAAIGLFGMSSYSSERRKKEIGIRKILGASLTSIVELLSKEFLILVAVANIIAWPAAYYAANIWLDNYAYRIEITPLPFILAAVIALMITLLTTGYHSLKSASENPVESLRYE